MKTASYLHQGGNIAYDILYVVMYPAITPFWGIFFQYIFLYFYILLNKIRTNLFKSLSTLPH